VDVRRIALQLRFIRVIYRSEADRVPAERLAPLRERSMAMLDRLLEEPMPQDLATEAADLRRELADEE
jgi:hypothetical protein